MSSASRILVGVIGAPHGIKGEVRIKSYTSRPTDIGRYRPILGEDGRTVLEIAALRPVKDDIVVARLAGVTSREAAAALTNARLYVERASLPAVEEEEFYHADLIGLRVLASDGVEMGQVAAVLNFGAGDILEVAVAGQDSLLVPFTKAFVPAVDLTAKTLQVDQDALAADASEAEDDLQQTGEAAGRRDERP